jgi:hypothetical protein
MDLVTISRNGQQFGPYTMDQVRSYLQAGNLVASDLAYDQRSQAWVPLSQFLGVLGLPGIPAPPPPPPGRDRNVIVLILLAIAWWLFLGILIFFVACIFAGMVAGMMDPPHAHEAGRAAGAWVGNFLGLPIFGVSLVLSIWLTVIGKLPGTGK